MRVPTAMAAMFLGMIRVRVQAHYSVSIHGAPGRTSKDECSFADSRSVRNLFPMGSDNSTDDLDRRLCMSHAVNITQLSGSPVGCGYGLDSSHARRDFFVRSSLRRHCHSS